MTSWTKLTRTSALTALAIALAAPVAVQAQEITATVTGQVVSEGTPIANATVIIVHTPSGTRATVRSGSDGRFSVAGLRVGGPFRVDVSASGYVSSAVTDVFLDAANPFTMTVDLESAQAGVQTVVVTASAVGRTRTDGSVTGLRRDAIEGVVAVDRDIRDLARRSPLVSTNVVGDGGLSIAGSNPRTNRITIDGVSAQDDFGLNTGGLPTRRGPISIDAVAQVNISPAPFDVRNGGFLGGAIDLVLRSGDNDFDGSVFTNLRSDELTGNRIDNTLVSNQVDQENWGFTLRGPILKDRLFFALSYETFSSFDTVNRGPIEGNFFNTITGPTGQPMSQANIDAVTSVFRNTYGSTYQFGSIPSSKPIEDEKYSLRLDWNIMEGQRASFTYRNAESTVFNFTNLGQTTASLDSMWYFTGEQDETYSIQLNSDWTDAFSTEARISLRDYTRLQEPPLGQNFADISVCSTPTVVDPNAVNNGTTNCRQANGQAAGTVRFGPDQFRHANYLTNQNLQAMVEGTYRLGDHTIKGGFHVQNRTVYNLFVPNSDATWYFDSIADFAAGRANRVTYSNHPSGDATRAAADFEYSIFAGYLQNTWQVFDNLRVTGGLRYERYSLDSKPAANAAFTARNGFSNEATYDGIDLIMPRFSFNWRPTDGIRVSGGVGLFSGGLPDVFLSNSFSNTGVLTVGLDIVRNIDAAGNTTFVDLGGVTLAPGQGASILNVGVGPAFGSAVPAPLQQLLSTLSALPLNETNSISPNYEMPSEWKFNLNLQADLPFDLQGTLDLVYNKIETGYAFRDLRATPLIVNGQVARTPDGRIRYDALSTAQRTAVAGTTVNSTAPVGGNRDIQLYNPAGDSLGETWVVAVGVGKDFDWGLSTSVSYVWTDITELNSSGRFSSTASSLYNGLFSSVDPNNPTKGEGQEEIENAVKYEVEWRGTPIGDLETRVSLFGDWRDGRPITFLMNGGAGRNPLFGVNKGGQLAYIPDLSGTVTQLNPTTWVVSSDTRVAFDSVATIDALRGVIGRFGLTPGQIVDRSAARNDDIHSVDMMIRQQVPAFREGDKAWVTFEISNLLNMLDESWGVVQEFNETQTLYSAVCAGADGLVSNAGTLTCNRYRIASPNTVTNQTRNVDRSRWRIQIGLRYEF